MTYLSEKRKETPVLYEADVCVVGGSATGVFAAVRAARLGARVVIVEKTNCFGGNATNGLMTVWHSLYSTDRKRQIISGLTEEAVSSMDPLDVRTDGALSHIFNPVEMKCVLDEMCRREGIKIYFHTFYAGLCAQDNEISAVFVENKDGRGAIKARFFIDATGDGDLCRDLGIERYTNGKLQPPSYVFLLQGQPAVINTETGERVGLDAVTLLNAHREEFDVEQDHGWSAPVTGLDNISMRVDAHVFYVQCANADELTRAELIGREKMRKMCRVLRKYGDPNEHYSLVGDCSHIGIRDSYHYRTRNQASFVDMFTGRDYDDCILNGSYSGDVQNEVDGTMFMSLDGTYWRIDPYGEQHHGNWRRERGLPTDVEMPTYYRLPFSTLVQRDCKNMIAVGRMIDADPVAYGALRVMVNLNQLGEAAGVAAYLALSQGVSVQELDGVEVARLLSRGGSANLG